MTASAFNTSDASHNPSPHFDKNSFEINYNANDPDLSLVEHLTELRNRIIKSLVAFVIGTGICFYFIETILSILTAPAGNLYYMRPAEAFMIYMKITLFAGLIVASPFIMYQGYRFVCPALQPKEKAFTLVSMPICLMLFIAGLLFSYYFVFPRGLDFFLGFTAGKISPLISMESYLDFLLMLVVPFGFVFNIPVLLLLLCYLRFVKVSLLIKYQKHIILAAFILAAFITPTPDIITQSLLALPMVILYEISLVLCKFLIKNEETIYV